MEEMTRTEERVEFLQRLSRVIYVLKNDYYLEFMIIWYHRTKDQQKALYEIGRSIPGKIVTNCDGEIKISNHQLWIAADLVLIQYGKIVWGRCEEYERLGEVAFSEGLGWGGDWDEDGEEDPSDYDIYHVELRREV